MTTLGLIATVILALYVLTIVVVLLIPPKQHDPQRGVGVGCLMMVGLAIGAVLTATVLGDLYGIRWLVWVGFVGAVFPAVSLTGAGVRWLILRARGIEE